MLSLQVLIMHIYYGSAKSAHGHLFTRLMAAESRPDYIRVNMINPDAVIAGSNIWAGGWLKVGKGI